MRKFPDVEHFFVIDLDSITQDTIYRDQDGKIIASIQVDSEGYHVEIKQTLTGIQFQGNGQGKNVSINSPIPCTFQERELQFNDLNLSGGPYHFQEETNFRAASLKIDSPFTFKNSELRTEKSFIVTESALLENSAIYSSQIDLQNVQRMECVDLHGIDADSTSCINFSKLAAVEHVFIETNQLRLSSSEGTVNLKKVSAIFDRIGFSGGHCQFLDSQLRDTLQTPEQIDRFQAGLKEHHFDEWHKAQLSNDRQQKQMNRIASGAKVTLLRSSLLVSSSFKKEPTARLCVEQQSVFATQWFVALDTSADEKDPTIEFQKSVLVAEAYEQLNGCAAFSHAELNITNDMSASNHAKLTVVDKTSIRVGRSLLLRNADYYHDDSFVHAKNFNAFGSEGLVVIRDSSLNALANRRVALKADSVFMNCRSGLQNIIVQANQWYLQNNLEDDNALVIATEILTHEDSYIDGKGSSFDAKRLYLGGKMQLRQPAYLIARDECIISEKGDIRISGQVVANFEELAHLGQFHIERELKSFTASKIAAKKARFHSGSKVTGESLVMDVDEVRLSGEIDMAKSFKLITKVGKLNGSIKSEGNIELASDYGLVGFGHRLSGRDIRIIGNLVSLLGVIEARRSYSRSGGLILDCDLRLATSVMTTALFSASLGIHLPNPSSSLDDLLSSHNLIRAGLTTLGFFAPHIAQIANAAYFGTKLIRVIPALAQMADNGLEQFEAVRLNRWIAAVSYLGAIGVSGYQECMHFHLDSDERAPHLDAKSVFNRMLPAFLSGEMNNSLIILNSGLNLLPSSLNNALLIGNANLSAHVNDTVSAVVDSHSGLEVAYSRMETVDVEMIQGAVVSRFHTLFAQHLHILEQGREVVTEHAQWKVDNGTNEGTLHIDTENDNSVIQTHQFADHGKTILTGVTVTGFQFIGYEESQARFHDVAFRDTIHIDNGHTSYTGYYAIETKNYIHEGTREALDRKAETIFSLKSDDAEFEGIVRDNKAYIEVKNLKNVKDFLQGRGAYVNYHVATALELITHQALELHGLDRDCDISLTAKSVHFDQDVSFHHNVYIHSKTGETVDYNMKSDHHLYVEANNQIILENKKQTDPRTQQPELVIDAEDGAYFKSDHGSIEGKAVNAHGEMLVFDADQDVNLDKRLPNMNDWHEMQRYLEWEQLSHATSTNETIEIYNKYAHMRPSERPSVLDATHIYLHSAHGNISYNGVARASDDLTMVADAGHVTATGTFTAGNRAVVLADGGFDFLSVWYFKSGRYGYHTAYLPSTLTAGSGGLSIQVAHGVANIDASNMHATGDVVVDANNINLLAQNETYVSNKERHSGFLGFNSYDQETETTEISGDHITSDSGHVTFYAFNFLRSNAAFVQGKQGTLLYGEHGARIVDEVGHVRTVTKESSWWGATYDKKTSDQEFNVPTTIVDSKEAVIYSPNGDVYSMGTLFMTPSGTVAGKNVYLHGRVLNNTWSEETRGLHVSLFGVLIYSSHTTYNPFQYSSPTWNDVNRAAHSHGATESALNYANLSINVYNTAQAFKSGLASGHPLQSLAQQEGLTPNFDIGLQTTQQSGRYQTMGNGGFYTGNLTVVAENRALFDRTPVEVAHDAQIQAHQFDQVGTALRSETTYRMQDITLGFSTQGLDSASFSAAQGSSQSENYVNEHFNVQGTLHMSVDTWTLDGANTDAQKFEGEVRKKLIEKTHTSTSNGSNSSERFDTGGGFGFSTSSQHKESITETAGVRIQDDTTFKTQEIDSQGGKFISDGKLEVDVDTMNDESVETHSHSDSFGISGNAHNFGDHQRDDGDTAQHIDTTTVTNSGSRHDETQQSVLHGERGTIINAKHNQGAADTTDSNGSNVKQDRHWDYQADIPMGVTHGTSTPDHTTAHPIPQVTDPTHDKTETHQNHPNDVRNNDGTDISDTSDAVETQRQDTGEIFVPDPLDDSPVISEGNNTDFLSMEAKPVDFVEENFQTFVNEESKNAASLPTFRERLSSVWSDSNLSYTSKWTYSGYYALQHGYDQMTSYLPSFSWDWNSWNPLNCDISMDLGSFPDLNDPIPMDPDVDVSDHQFLENTDDTAYVNALVSDPVESLMIYDVNRQAANSLYGRPLLYEINEDLDQMTQPTYNFSDYFNAMGNIPATMSNMLLNAMWGIGHDPANTLKGFGTEAFNAFLFVLQQSPVFYLGNALTKSKEYYLPISSEQQPGTDLFNLSSMLMPVADMAGITESVSQASLLRGSGLFAQPVLDETLFHSRGSKSLAQSIIDGVNEDRLNPDNRFGAGLYLSEVPETTLAELKFHGINGQFTIRYEFNAEDSLTLDLTDPKEAERWGYQGGEDYKSPQAIAEEAKYIGYTAIRFPSERGAGANLVILGDFDKLLFPKEMLSASQFDRSFELSEKTKNTIR